MNAHFDVIVIGGGHAGTEAALASARIGARTLLITQSIQTIGQMSCNPAIGGIGKSQLAREVDAMGGAMCLAADRAGIHFRILNGRKGPAVRATRAQADRALYAQAIRTMVEQQPHLHLFQQSVDDLIVEGEHIKGVRTAMGLDFFSRRVVLTVGTFLGGRIHIGETKTQGGRAGDAPSNRLAERLRELPFTVDRLKTGTPPRIDARSLDHTKFQEQPGDTPRPVFGFMSTAADQPRQVLCHIARTNANTHEIIEKNRHRSPMMTGAIEGVGPRYCPSIEDKVVRFADKDSHQIFIEPEGLNTHEIYPNGISTSLPFDVQEAFVKSVAGFENAHITRPGYAIEYDFFNPQGLHKTLETKPLKGLYFAGQINGTTGYEEAAAQGLLAGTNAALSFLEKAPWVPTRSDAYMGVLVDDLITLGTQEPYRMFTSRAEHRLTMREDNADERLTPKAHELGLISDTHWQAFCEHQDAVAKALTEVNAFTVHPHLLNKAKANTLGLVLKREYKASELLKRPELDVRTLGELVEGYTAPTDARVALQVNVQTKYSGYIDRQLNDIARQKHQEELALPTTIDYQNVTGLSNEVKQKLAELKPSTLGQAARVPGVTPAAISVLLIHLKKRQAA